MTFLPGPHVPSRRTPALRSRRMASLRDPEEPLSEEPFAVVDATAWIEAGDEPMGSAVKRWLEVPQQHALRSVAPKWLFKEVRAKWVHEEWRVFGEDWSEKIVAELAQALGVPTARVELAVVDGRRGVVTPAFIRTPDQSFTPGNELLAGRDPEYSIGKTGQVPGYNLQAVRQVLEPYAAPECLPEDVADAFAAFAGYLLLDALVANTDRHHENWGVVGAVEGPARLAPSYDHGTSLGFQEPHERKRILLDDVGRLSTWVRRGRSRHFEGRPSLIGLAAEALSSVPAAAAAYWLARLETLESSTWERMLDRIPADRMSQVDRTFAAALLRLNRERLLDAC